MKYPRSTVTDFAKIVSETLNEGSIRQIITFLRSSASIHRQHADSMNDDGTRFGHIVTEAHYMRMCARYLETILEWKNMETLNDRR